jgi:hypothetical protein
MRIHDDFIYYSLRCCVKGNDGIGREKERERERERGRASAREEKYARKRKVTEHSQRVFKIDLFFLFFLTLLVAQRGKMIMERNREKGRECK